MHLKRLQLIGFKTFAERTQIEFAPGVTAIVGPNGSGKSNIADAILWALGEQRMSAIRGSKLQDVIFSGSALRKATGLAEVSLTIDNSDGCLPLSYDEITVTRRAYRNGEGEFFINKNPCRLRDIQELFLDTGVGRESYALVNQSEVDSVLSADPQARRSLFEEAAGIHKFRTRKREALRKLEQTESNLVRIRDIVREIERHLGPLEAQAQIAVRYNEARARLESLEKSYLISEVRQVDSALAQVRREFEILAEKACERSESASAAEALAAELARESSDADGALETARLRRDAANSRVERLRSERELAAQRANGNSAQTDLIRTEIEGITDQLAGAEVRAQASGDGASEEHDVIIAQRAKLQFLDEERRAILSRIDQIKLAEDSRRQRSSERDRTRMTRESEVASLTARLDQASDRATDFDRRAREARKSVDELGGQKKAGQDAMRAAKADLDRSANQTATYENEIHSGRDLLAGSRSALADLQAEMAAESSRLQTLKELEAAQEGYYSGVRAVLLASERGRLTGDYTVVASAFKTPAGFESAFEAALGGSLQDIIVETEIEAKAAIEMLKRDRAGRATFFPLNRIKPAGPRPTVPANVDGFIGCAAEIATYEARYRGVIEMLLGRALMCETIDSALKTADLAKGWSKIVTVAGEVLYPSGAISGGSAAKVSGSLLHRKLEIGSLTDRIQTRNTRLAERQQDVDSAIKQLEATLAQHAATSNERARRQQAVNAAERGLDQIMIELRRMEHELVEIASRQAIAASEIESLKQLRSRREEELAAWLRIQDAEARPGSEFGGESQSLPSLNESDSRLLEEITQLRIALAGAQEKLRGDTQSAETARSEIARLKAQRARHQERMDSLSLESETLANRLREIVADDAAVAQAMAEAKVDFDNCLVHQREKAQAAREAQARAHTLSEERSEARAAAQLLEVKEARLQLQYTQSVARLLDEYDLTPADALGLAQTPIVAPDTPREVARLRRELRSFGDVNASAAAEFDELRTRHDSMFEQQQDAEIAKQKVLTAIREIDDSTRGMFMASFHQVAEAFEEVFQRLMGGGRTELTLTDPDNLLETGIEIAVQAPGKKKQNLMLLSGGERALTAIALLFAFLKVRPAPFCVLDEVDAPLDGVNVERFADLLNEFGREGQFLVITHNPSTMEGARCWYGVTMKEPGISHVLSMESPRTSDMEPSRADPHREVFAEAVPA